MKTHLVNNKEIRLFTVCCAALGLAGSVACAFIHPVCALICLGLTAALLAAFLVFTSKRYKKLAELSANLDKLLNGGDVELSKFSEGEFSILENRLSKLVHCLRDQADALEKDKLLLADSIADISHQIKTPLTSISLLSSALAEVDAGEAGDAARRKSLADMHSQIDRMDWLVSALLKLAKLDADAVKLNAQSVSLAALIRLAAEPLEIMMELKGQRLDVDAAGETLCDASWTAEALTNIIKNCSENMGEGALSVTASENPLYSEIVIRDRGNGIDAEDLPHIFERFYRGKHSSNNGVGIGLALARSIIVKQNGTVKAENAQDGGAKFTVRLYKSAV